MSLDFDLLHRVPNLHTIVPSLQDSAYSLLVQAPVPFIRLHAQQLAPWVVVAVALIAVMLVVKLVVALLKRCFTPRAVFNPDHIVVDDEQSTASKDSPYDVVVVGAGVAGASLAAYLGRHGKKVLVVERDFSEPHRIIGELLQPGGVAKLKELGLEECFEGYDAQDVAGYAVLYKDRHLKIKYPDLNGAEQFGKSFHNGKFVQALRAAARKSPGVNMIQGTVTKLLTNSSGRVTGVVYRQDGQIHRIRAPLTVLSDGCFSYLRESLNAAECKLKSHFLGVILKNCTLPFPQRGNVVLANPTPILCYPISSKETRILVDFPEKIPTTEGGELERVLLKEVKPQLPKSLQKAFDEAVRAKQIKTMPNRILPARPCLTPGAVLLGDTLNMRHPLTGGGMTVALTDVANLGQQLLKLQDFSVEKNVTKAVKSFYDTRDLPASSINILSEALYDVFSEKNNDLREACFDYLGLGGEFSQGPMSLLGGISRRQSKLIIHFFAVALYGVIHSIRPFPTPSRIIRAYKMLRTAVYIIRPLLVKQNKDSILNSCFCLAMRVLFFV